MKRFITTSISLLFFIICIFAQYPQEILPGKPKTFDSGKDTLWVLSNSQFNKAIVTGKELKLKNEETNLLKSKIIFLENKELQKDSIAMLIISNRDNYEKKWHDCESDLAIVGAGYEKVRRQARIFKLISIVGVPSAFLIGLLLL